MADLRPIADDERPHLDALGELVRALRHDAGLSQVELGRRAVLSGSQVSAIERGRHRTRRSTLERVVGVLFDDEDRVEVVLAELLEAVGPALAPESDYAERVERRRIRRERKAIPQLIKMHREQIRLERDLARRHIGRVSGLDAVVALHEAEIVKLEARYVELEVPAPDSVDRGRPAFYAFAAFCARPTPPLDRFMHGLLDDVGLAEYDRLHAAMQAEEAERGG